jgi:SAM-dependent methyltransferase
LTNAEALSLIVLDPHTTIISVVANSFRSARFDSAEEKTIYVITIQTNNRTMVSGSIGYKSSYKERLEGLLDYVGKRESPLVEVHIDIEGPDSDSPQKLLRIEELVAAGKVASNSPVVETARRFHIPYILIRGRHVIAPSPAIAEYLSVLVHREEQEFRSVLDLFGGTGLTAKVMCQIADPSRVVVVEKDAHVLRLMREHIRDKRVVCMLGDAFTYDIAEQFDLAVVDPYYEDVLVFIRSRLDSLLQRTRIVLLVPGNVEDVAWNAGVERMIRERGVRIGRFEAYGQVVLDVRGRPH